MDLHNAEQLANDLMAEHLNSLPNVQLMGLWTFKWNNRKRGIGLCCYGTRTIQLSRHNAAKDSEEQVTQTILHEIAHALCPGSGHGRVWKATARRLGVHNPKSTRKVASTDSDSQAFTWVMICEDEVVKRYYRKPNRNTFQTLSNRYLVGRPDTRGKLQIIPMEQYLRMK